MGQIRGQKAHIDACNLRRLSSFGIPATGQHILVSTDNSAMQNGQGDFDAYVVGDGTTPATALELHYFAIELLNSKCIGTEFDFSTYTSVKGYFINNNAWTSNANVYYMLIPTSDIPSDAIIVTANAESSAYVAFLTSNVVPSSPVPYANGTGMTVMSVNETKAFVIPEDATYMYLMAAYQSTSRLPSSIQYLDSFMSDYNGMKTLVNEHDEQLKILGLSNTELNIASYDVLQGCPQGATSWTVKDNRSHIDIMVSAGERYRICANNSFESLFVLLKNKQTPTDGLAYDLATGETGVRSITAGSCEIITIPDNCTCMSVGIDGSSTSVTRDYTPSSITKVTEIGLMKDQIDELNEKIDGGGTEATLTLVQGTIQTTLTWSTSTTGYMMAISPNQKFQIIGTSSFVQLKTNTIQSGAAANVSDYWSGYNTINYNVTTNVDNILYAAPDVNYIFFVSKVKVLLFNEYNTYQRNQFQYTDMLKYMMNKSCQYVIHHYLRVQHPGIGTFSVSSGEQSYRGCAACAEALAGVYALGIMDLSIIGTSMSNLIWQAKRMILSASNSYEQWKLRWQSSLAATKYGNAAYMIKDYLSNSEYNAVLSIVESEANALITKQVGTLWNDNNEFGLYWKNSDGTTNYNGDSKSEEVGWYAGCLATAIFLMPENTNVANWKRKLVEWSVISYASPSSKTSGKVYNGYALSNLTGYNITDDGLVINHSQIHPDYMASRTICLMDGFFMWLKEGKMIPQAAQENMDLIYYGYTERNFTEGETLYGSTVQPPYGTIYKTGANDLYYPQGNDWGSVRFYSLAEYAGYLYNLCLHPKDDASRISTILWAHVKQLQDRFTTGAVHKEDGSENSYEGREPSIANEILGQLVIGMYPIFWTSEDWFQSN